MNPDSAENRMYIQRNRLWLLGEVIAKRLIEERSPDPVHTALQVLAEEKEKQTESIDPPSPEAAAEAKEYLLQHNIAPMIEEWFKDTLLAKPESPIDFSIGFFNKMSEGAKEEAQKEQALTDAI